MPLIKEIIINSKIALRTFFEKSNVDFVKCVEVKENSRPLSRIFLHAVRAFLFSQSVVTEQPGSQVL